MKLSLKIFRKRLNHLGYSLDITPSGVYQVTTLGDFGPAYSGSYEQVVGFLAGVDFERQHTDFHYHKLPREKRASRHGCQKSSNGPG
jgi:hypothetical protein